MRQSISQTSLRYKETNWSVSPQNDNVPFAQSRNVLLTPFRLVAEGQLLMTQAERDRLVALKKAKKKLITQKQAAEELGITERHVRRLLRQLKRRGDEVVTHALRGLPSNRKIGADTEQEAVAILSRPVYRGFGPTLASEYLAKKHDIAVSRETVRQWMIGAKLWKARKQRIEKVHEWRPRRSRFGELVQWDTSPHDWLEGRGEEILLINMIDDATSRWFARFVASDSTVENMNLLERYLKKHKRPLAFYTDKAAIFQTAEKTKRDGSGLGKSREELPPTQIGRALQELAIPWIAAHSPQAKAYASYCTSCEPRKTFSGKRRRLASLTPWALRGGLGPGSSYNQSSRSFTG
jgi:hypothetical protein